MDRVNAVIAHLSPAGQHITPYPGPHATPCSGGNNCSCTRSAEKRPMRVCVTGAAGQIAYALLPRIASGQMLGADQPVILHLLDIPPAEAALNGVVMELEDGAFPLLRGIVASTDPAVAFQSIDIAILVGARPRGPGMERKDLLKANAAIFSAQGRALNQYASRNVKVLVVGNPANTNCLLAMKSAPSIARENFSALTRLDQNRATAQIAKHVGVDRVGDVRNVVIWGNHSATQVPDLSQAFVESNGSRSPLYQHVEGNMQWFQNVFVKTVQQRGAAIIKARKLSSAASAANAIIDHMRDWMLGTAPGQVVSMAVLSNGGYGAPKDVIFSFPVTTKPGGRYEIVKEWPMTVETSAGIVKTSAELEGEARQALEFL